MRAVVQRVKQTRLSVDGKLISEIPAGLVVYFGVAVGDTKEMADYFAKKIANMRIFEDENGKMNKSILDVGGEILAISQFTLFGDARSQRRPGFTGAARPDKAIPMYEGLVQAWRDQGIHVETGVFGADMQVSLVNDGPVTMLMDSTKLF